MATSSVIEVLIETLHGTAFELLVSPDDTVLSIKSRISRLEGIPVSHQHLIWRDHELADMASLRECEIRDGSTIRLVLGLRGGPINTRKASVDERPTLYEVAKYLDAKGEEVSLSIPKMRAMRMVVMREGDKVHLYTVVDRPTSGLLRDHGHHPHEPAAEEGFERHQENLVTRQKVDDLQKRMHMCRLRKDGKSGDDEGKATTQPVALPPVQPPVLPPVQPALPPMQPYGLQGRRWSNNACWNRAPSVPRAAAGVVLPQMMMPVPPGYMQQQQPSGCQWRLPCQGTSGHGCHPQQQQPPPPARPEPFGGAIPKERGPRLPHSQDHCRKCTALLERMYGLDRRGGVEGWQCKQPSVLLSFGQMDVPSSRGGTSPRPEEGPLDPRNFFKHVAQQVLPPVGRPQQQQQQRRCSCVPPNRPPEQNVATAPILEPLELDWTAERPRTAPTTRYVRLPSLRRPPLRSPEKGKEGPSAHDPGCPLALLDSEEEGAATGVAFRQDSTAHKHGPPDAGCWAPGWPLSSAVLCVPPPPAAAGAEGIRWALSDVRNRRTSPPVLAPSRMHMGPLLQRVQDHLWRAENPMRHSTAAWGARLAADNQGDDPKDQPPPPPQGGPPTNGHPSANQERTSSAESRESNASDMSAATAAGEGSNGQAAAGGTLSVDTRGSSELSSSSSGGGGPPDDDSNSTSESKTDDGASSADAQHPSPGKAKKKGKRCSWCNKKTGLASTYICRCGNIFCAAHRYAEAHACSHDYKAEGRYILQRNNPVVKAAKLPKI